MVPRGGSSPSGSDLPGEHVRSELLHSGPAMGTLEGDRRCRLPPQTGDAPFLAGLSLERTSCHFVQGIHIGGGRPHEDSPHNAASGAAHTAAAAHATMIVAGGAAHGCSSCLLCFIRQICTCQSWNFRVCIIPSGNSAHRLSDVEQVASAATLGKQNNGALWPQGGGWRQAGGLDDHLLRCGRYPNQLPNTTDAHETTLPNRVGTQQRTQHACLSWVKLRERPR